MMSELGDPDPAPLSSKLNQSIIMVVHGGWWLVLVEVGVGRCKRGEQRTQVTRGLIKSHRKVIWTVYVMLRRTRFCSLRKDNRLMN
jgi:hypothetical protein